MLPRGYTDCVKSCTSAEAIYKEGPQKENGFILACQYGHKDIVEYILEKDYFKHLLNGIEDIENKTGFYWACANGHVQIVEVLLNERSGRIDYNVVGREGMTGYLVSFEKGHTELVKLFLQTSIFKFDFEIKENCVESVKSQTGFILACKNGHTGKSPSLHLLQVLSKLIIKTIVV